MREKRGKDKNGKLTIVIGSVVLCIEVAVREARRLPNPAQGSHSSLWSCRLAVGPVLPSGRSPDREGLSFGDRLSTLSNCTAFGARNYPAGVELPRMVHAVAKPRGERALQRASSRRRPAAPNRQKPKLSSNARRCRAKFLEHFLAAFHYADASRVRARLQVGRPPALGGCARPQCVGGIAGRRALSGNRRAGGLDRGADQSLVLV